MSKTLILFAVIAFAGIGSAKWILKNEDITKTSAEWTEAAKKLEWDNEQTTAAVDLMKFLQDFDYDSMKTTEMKDGFEEKCKNLAKFDKIDEMDDKMTDKKWEDMKAADLTDKCEFWQQKFKMWENDDDKMKALKNMCILVTEDKMKSEYKERAKKAGLEPTEFKPMADMMWEMKSAKSDGEMKSIMLNNCDKLKNDDTMLMLSAQHDTGDKKWDDMKDKDISTKMQFWWDKMKMVECKIARVKTLKNMCVLYMDSKERKMIDDWAKMAEFTDEEKKAAVDLEMKLKICKDKSEKRTMMHMNCKELGKNKQIMDVPMDADQMKSWEEVKTKEHMDKMHFWVDKYKTMTESNKMKALKNMCVIVMEHEEKMQH